MLTLDIDTKSATITHTTSSDLFVSSVTGTGDHMTLRTPNTLVQPIATTVRDAVMGTNGNWDGGRMLVLGNFIGRPDVLLASRVDNSDSALTRYVVTAQCSGVELTDLNTEGFPIPTTKTVPCRLMIDDLKATTGGAPTAARVEGVGDFVMTVPCPLP